MNELRNCGHPLGSTSWCPDCALAEARRNGEFCMSSPAASPEAVSAVVAGTPEPWRNMATAPKDGTLLQLLVDFEHHATKDGEGPQPTIGSNTWDNHHDFDEWQFAGWNWEQDCYTQGVGTPVGWLPILDTVHLAAPTQAGAGDAKGGA